MDRDLVIKDSNLDSTSPALQIDGNADHMLVVLESDGRETKLVFRGCKYNLKDWETKMHRQGRGMASILDVPTGWTRDKPQEPGHYWFIHDDFETDLFGMIEHEVEAVKVNTDTDGYPNSVMLMGTGMPGDWKDDIGYWYGPIDQPELPREAKQ
jgi:hypothetical protein